MKGAGGGVEPETKATRVPGALPSSLKLCEACTKHRLGFEKRTNMAQHPAAGTRAEEMTGLERGLSS